MAYYWIPLEQRVTQFPATLYARWIVDGNPKKDYYVPIVNPPGENHYYTGTAWVPYGS